MFEVWSQDLNSLYNTLDSPPVLFDKVESREEAIKLVRESAKHMIRRLGL